MTSSEKTYARPSEYSTWHRSLGAQYTAIDIDFVEIREGRVVALFGVTMCNDEKHTLVCKDEILRRTELERNTLRYLARQVGCESYYVIHSRDMRFFLVIRLSDMHEWNLDETQYAAFLKML